MVSKRRALTYVSLVTAGLYIYFNALVFWQAHDRLKHMTPQQVESEYQGEVFGAYGNPLDYPKRELTQLENTVLSLTKPGREAAYYLHNVQD